MIYPSVVSNCSHGKCLRAQSDLTPGTIVEILEGNVLRKEEIPESEIRYAIWINIDTWMILKTNARYINHSCLPNCYINDDLQIITTKTVKKGEELTISYNLVLSNENPGIWDEKWTFECRCGAENCQKLINKYISEDGTLWTPDAQKNKNRKEVPNNLSENIEDMYPTNAISVK